jgi:hypothetical protein
VHTWSGQCNKNLGNAFVIVWRIGDEYTLAAGQQQHRLRGGSNDAPLGANSSGSIKRGASNNSNGSNDAPEALKKRAATVDLRRVPGVDILGELNRKYVILCILL